MILLQIHRIETDNEVELPARRLFFGGVLMEEHRGFPGNVWLSVIACARRSRSSIAFSTYSSQLCCTYCAGFGHI